MPSPRAFLLASLLIVSQLTLSVDAKGGGKGSSSKSSKKKPKTKSNPVVLEENGKCYDANHIEIKCPTKKNTGLIVGIVIGVIGAVLILILAVWFFKRRSQKKSKKGLDLKSREFDDASSDHESIVPLVHGETKEKDREYNYQDKSVNV